MPFWTSKHTDSTLSAISLALRGIKAASSLINGVPGLELAVGSALSLVTTIQKVRGNKERAHRLAELVMNSIEHLYKSVASRLDAIDERLERDITTLRRKLLGTQQKIEKQLRKRMHKRILNHHAMSRILDECATDIDDARQVFLMDSVIALRQQSTTIVARIGHGRLPQKLTSVHSGTAVNMAMSFDQIRMGAAFFF